MVRVASDLTSSNVWRKHDVGPKLWNVFTSLGTRYLLHNFLKSFSKKLNSEKCMKSSKTNNYRVNLEIRLLNNDS